MKNLLIRVGIVALLVSGLASGAISVGTTWFVVGLSPDAEWSFEAIAQFCDKKELEYIEPDPSCLSDTYRGLVVIMIILLIAVLSGIVALACLTFGIATLRGHIRQMRAIEIRS